TTAVPSRRRKKLSRVRPPRRPIARKSAALATPVIKSATTSGMTVIRMALIHRTPTGAMAAAACASRAFPEIAIAIPPAKAANNATSTRVLSFICSSHHEVAAVDVEHGTGDVARPLGRREADEV